VDGDPEQVFVMMQHYNPGVYYLLGCGSARADHTVVCCGDKVVCDPSPEGGMLKRMSNGYCFVDVLVPLNMKQLEPLWAGDDNARHE